MTPERRAVILAYCRIDALAPEDELLFDSCCMAAAAYMAQAGIAGPEEGTPRRDLYDLCVNALVLDSWDRRGTSSSGGWSYTVVENRDFRQKLNQLKMTEPVPKLDTGM